MRRIFSQGDALDFEVEKMTVSWGSISDVGVIDGAESPFLR